MDIRQIREELRDHLKNHIQEVMRYDMDELEIDDLFHQAFNQDYYLIGYAYCDDWLTRHDINIFEGIRFVQRYERENFGADAVRTYENSEQLVNMIAYIIGEEITHQEGRDLIAQREQEIEVKKQIAEDYDGFYNDSK